MIGGDGEPGWTGGQHCEGASGQAPIKSLPVWSGTLGDGPSTGPTGQLSPTASQVMCDYFVATKRAEVRASQADVTPWELERYLQAF